MPETVWQHNTRNGAKWAAFLIRALENSAYLPVLSIILPHNFVELRLSRLNAAEIDPIIAEFQKIVKESFGNNLIFAFVFGSAAKGSLKVVGQNRHDLDTFVCLQTHDKSATDKYLVSLRALHQAHGLSVDEQYPAEIVTLEQLNDTLKALPSITVDLHQKIGGESFDRIFWAHALTDVKKGVTGDAREMSSFIKKCQPHIFRWGNAIRQQLREVETLPSHINGHFPGLTKSQVLEKFEKLTIHLVIHLGLLYDGVQPDQKHLHRMTQ